MRLRQCGQAVLPFTNMSGDLEQEYFVDGLVEDYHRTVSYRLAVCDEVADLFCIAGRRHREHCGCDRATLQHAETLRAF